MRDTLMCPLHALVSRLPAAAPESRPSSAVTDGDDQDFVSLRAVVDAIRKPRDRSDSNFTTFDAGGQRVFGDESTRTAHLFNQRPSQSLLLCLVEAGRVSQFLLRLWESVRDRATRATARELIPRGSPLDSTRNLKSPRLNATTGPEP